MITISSRNEGDDEDHFTSYSLFMDGSYFGQINNPTSERVVRLPMGKNGGTQLGQGGKEAGGVKV